MPWLGRTVAEVPTGGWIAEFEVQVVERGREHFDLSQMLAAVYSVVMVLKDSMCYASL